MKRSATVLILAALLLLIPAPAHADSSGQELTGDIVFSGISHFNASLNLSIYYMIIDGRNWSADEIRSALESGNPDVEGALRESAGGLFDAMLSSFGAEGNLSTAIVPGDSGPVVVEMNGTGRLSSGCDSDVLTALGESGAVFSFTLEALGTPASIKIQPPEGYTVNAASIYNWDGSAQHIKVLSHPDLGSNGMDVLLDIYRIDTSGSNQRVYVNISLDAEASWIPFYREIPGNRSIYLEKADIRLLNTLLDCGYLEHSDVESAMETVMEDAREMMVAELPNITFTYSGWELGSDSVSMLINGSASMPVSDLLGQTAFIRKLVTQSMSVNLYGTEGFSTTYTITIPEGMTLGNTYVSPYTPHHFGYYEGRDAVIVYIDGSGTYRLTMEVGVMVDLYPLVPLIGALFAVFVAWALVVHFVPSRRRR